MSTPHQIAICMGSDLKAGVFSSSVRAEICRYGALRDLADLSPSAALAETTVLLTSWGTPVIGPEVLGAAPRLEAIFHAAGTVKTIVTPQVFERGIVVSSAAGEMAELVAVITYSFITLAVKRMLRYRAEYQTGRWVRRTERMDIGFEDKTFGLVGGSRIGVAVAKRLVADRRQVLVYDPYWTRDQAAAIGVQLADLDTLLRRSDIVSLHAPDLESTHHMIDRSKLALMRDGATIINTARGRLIDTDALLKECASGRLDAFLDVTDPEPLPPEHGLHHLPNVFLTPHLAGNEGSDLARMGMFAAEELRRYAMGAPLRGRIDPAVLARLA